MKNRRARARRQLVENQLIMKIESWSLRDFVYRDLATDIEQQNWMD